MNNPAVSLGSTEASRAVAGIHLPIQAPFHLEATVRVLQRRPSNRVDVWEQDRYLRAFAVADGLALVEVMNYGTIDDPDVCCSILSGGISIRSSDVIRRTLRRILGLDVDPSLLQGLAESDLTLGSTVLALRGMRPPRFADLFESFARVIPFQQLSLDAGVAIVGRFIECFGKCLEYGGRRYYAFPAAQAIAQARSDQLRSCGLSLKKAQALRFLARAIDSSELTEAQLTAMNTRDALKTLIALPGVGPWSAGLVLLRGLGRLDVFPPGDVGAARGLRNLLNLDPTTPIDDVVERFGDQRGYLYFCSLAESLRTKGIISITESQT